MEKYEGIMRVINEKLESDKMSLEFLRESKAKLEQENADLKEANAKLEEENAQLKLALMN